MRGLITTIYFAPTSEVISHYNTKISALTHSSSSY